MFDELLSGKKGAFAFANGRFTVETAIRSHSRLQTMWVYGLHWPRCCECDGSHVPINFGEGHFGGKFLVTHLDFWKGTGLEVEAVEAEMNRWLATGDLPDWATQANT